MTAVLVAAIACLPGCLASPANGVFSLPAASAPGTALRVNGTDPASPAFADAFGGYVGSVAALGPLATFEDLSALAFVPDGTLYVADGPCLRHIAPDSQGRQTVSTVAGDWTQTGSADGPNFQARFNHIDAMVGLPDGNLLVADGPRLRHVVFDGHGNGHVTTVAGTAEPGDQDGDGATARFSYVTSMARAGDGKIFATHDNHVREIDFDPASGHVTVSTFYVDGVIDPEDWDSPYFQHVAAVDADTVWITGNGVARRLQRGPDGKGTPDLVVKGDEPSARPGEASWGAFGEPRGIGVLPNGDVAVIAYQGNMRRVSVDGTGEVHVSLLARPIPFQPGTRYGSWLYEGLSSPDKLAVGPQGEIAVLDQTAVRRIEPDETGLGIPTTFAGWPVNGKRQDGPAAATSLHPQAIVPTGQGGYYAAVGNALYEMQLTEMGGATTRFLAGDRNLGEVDGVGAQARFDQPNGLLVLPDGSLLVNDAIGARLRRVTFDAQGQATVTTIAGGGNHSMNADSLTVGDGPGLTAAYNGNSGLALGPDGAVYFGDSHRLRKVALDESGQWVVTSLAGRSRLGIYRVDGPGDQARFGQIRGLVFDRSGALFVADEDNHLIRKVVFDDAGQATVSTIAGTLDSRPGSNVSGFRDGPAEQALFYHPNDLALAPDGALLVTDLGNSAIRRVSQDAGGAWQVSTLIGPERGMQDGPFAQARLTYPSRLVADGAGKFLCLDGNFPTFQLRTIRLGGER